jgi:hypothetical protein
MLRLKYRLGNTSTIIKYGVGQGMGLYSSWAILDITHHVIVRYSAALCGIRNFRDYLVLGDDIVIARDLVSVKYLEVIEQLGVSIRKTKSIISSELAACEFASKLVKGNDNLSPLPIGLIGKRDLISQIQIINHAAYRTFTEWGTSWTRIDFLNLLQSVIGKK